MNVRFEGNNGHDADVTRCLLMTQSGHSGRRVALASRGSFLSSDAINRSRQVKGGPSLVGSVDVVRQLTTHIEFENTGNHDNGLRPISVLEHCKPERLSTIDEESAAEAARVPNNPVSSAVLANEKQRRPRTRGRLDLFHTILRDLTQ